MVIRYRNMIMVFVISMMSMFVFSTSVLADREDVDSVAFIATNQTEIASICARANNVVEKEILVYTGNDGLLSFSNSKYKSLTVDERRDFMETALLLTKESGMGSQIKNKTYNFIANQDSTTSAAVRYLRSDTSADFASAASWFKPFGSVAGVILGLLSLLIFMFLGLSILFDVAYMVLPPMRLLLTKGENEKPKFVSIEAHSSVKKSEESVSGNYEGSLSIYFKRRIPTIIIMSVALGYLISGQIYNVIVYIIDSFAWAIGG